MVSALDDLSAGGPSRQPEHPALAPLRGAEPDVIVPAPAKALKGTAGTDGCRRPGIFMEETGPRTDGIGPSSSPRGLLAAESDIPAVFQPHGKRRIVIRKNLDKPCRSNPAKEEASPRCRRLGGGA